MEAESIIKKYLTQKEFDEITSILTSDKTELEQGNWDKLYDISSFVLESEMENSSKIKICLDLFRILPSYYHFLNPFYHLFRENKLDSSEKELLFANFRNNICDNFKPGVRKMTEYVLWVGFFEDCETSDEAWSLLINAAKSEDDMAKFITFAGPVKYELKEKIYMQRVANGEFHQNILDSIYCSYVDVYGKVDRERVSEIFNMLDIDKNQDKCLFIKEKLENI